jgi:hypothetical protein
LYNKSKTVPYISTAKAGSFTEHSMKTIINWRVFFMLWIASVIAIIAMLPYTLELQSGVLEQLDLPIPFPILITLQVIQSALLFAVCTFLGMLLAKRIGLGTPVLDAVARGESALKKVRAFLPISIGLGILASVLIIGLDAYIFQPALIQELGEKANALDLTVQPAAWKGFLASFYGGIAEEILLRLFFMSLLVWLGSFINATKDGRPTNTIFWMANILAAILFGLAHLPAVSTIIPITTLVIIRTVLLNSIGGILFGWLYQKFGLESAMIAHFSADIVLHVLMAL